MAPILQVKDLTKRYGGLVAVNDVSFDVEPNEILSVIGPNGAGKSTIFKLISSLCAADARRGDVQGRSDFRPCAAHRRAQRRRAHVPGDDDLQGHDARATASSSRITCARRRASSASIFGSATARRDEAEFGRSSDADPRLSRTRRGQARDREQPAAGPFARAGHRDRPCRQSEDPAARRALRRHEPRRDQPRRRDGARGARPRRHAAAGRARHGGGDEDLRPHRRASISA